MLQISLRRPEQAPRLLSAGGQRHHGQVRRRNCAAAQARKVHLHSAPQRQLLHAASLPGDRGWREHYPGGPRIRHRHPAGARRCVRRDGAGSRPFGLRAQVSLTCIVTYFTEIMRGITIVTSYVENGEWVSLTVVESDVALRERSRCHHLSQMSTRVHPGQKPNKLYANLYRVFWKQS